MSWLNAVQIVKGPISSRPAAGAVPPYKYGWFATDTLVLSISDGSVWTDIGPGGGGGIPQGGPLTQALDADGFTIENLVDPSGAQDAATKSYVDALVNGAEWKQQSRLATTAALPSNNYSNGASGVGATLTGVAFGALTIDGVTPTVGDRVLVKNEATPANNGIYTVTTVGAIATLYVLTRATDYNQAAEVSAGTATFVTEGTANADTAWVQTTTGTITMGSTSLVFVQFGSGGGGVTSINKTGSTALTGAVTLTGGTNVALTQSGQDISIAASPGSPGAGGSSLVYRYTVTGSDKASIDTGVDTPDAGSNDWTNGDLLEIYFVGRVDQSAAARNAELTFNNDSSNIYDQQWLDINNASVSAGTVLAGAFLPILIPGATLAANYPGSVLVTIPNYSGTTFYKTAAVAQAVRNSSSAGSNFAENSVFTYRSTSALTRLKIAAGSTFKFKVGSQLLILIRLAS